MDTNTHTSPLIATVKSFDYYRKLPQDLSEKSSSGGIGEFFLKKNKFKTQFYISFCFMRLCNDFSID